MIYLNTAAQGTFDLASVAVYQNITDVPCFHKRCYMQLWIDQILVNNPSGEIKLKASFARISIHSLIFIHFQLYMHKPLYMYKVTHLCLTFR